MPSIFGKLNQIKNILLPSQQVKSDSKRKSKAKGQKKVNSKNKSVQVTQNTEQDKQPQTKPKKKKVRSTEVVSWEERRNSDTLFAARPTVLLGFPLTKPKEKPKGMHLLYQRSNGWFKIDIVSDPRFGVPFGQDQLFLLAVIDHALRSDSRKVEIRSIYKILKALGMSDSGSQYRHIQQVILRVFGSTVSCWHKDGNGVTGDKINYFSRVHLELLKDKYAYDPAEGDYITLSEELFEDLKKHPIPYDMEMLKRLKSSPGAMRLYLWAAQRAYRIPASKGAVFIPFDDLANDLGADLNGRKRRFKQSISGWTKKVSDELMATIGKKLIIDIKEGGILLHRQTMLHGAQRMTPTIENKASVKAKKKPTYKEFEVDWVLEKEIEDFRTGQINALTQKANRYRANKEEYEKLLRAN